MLGWVRWGLSIYWATCASQMCMMCSHAEAPLCGCASYNYPRSAAGAATNPLVGAATPRAAATTTHWCAHCSGGVATSTLPSSTRRMECLQTPPLRGIRRPATRVHRHSCRLGVCVGRTARRLSQFRPLHELRR